MTIFIIFVIIPTSMYLLCIYYKLCVFICVSLISTVIISYHCLEILVINVYLIIMIFFLKKNIYLYTNYFLSYQCHDCLVFFKYCSCYNYSTTCSVGYLSSSNIYMIFFRSNIFFRLI